MAVLHFLVGVARATLFLLRIGHPCPDEGQQSYLNQSIIMDFYSPT